MMNDKTFNLVKTMTELQATSGFENNVRDVMREKMTPNVDEVVQDGLGGIFGIRNNADTNAPKIMTAAHMDEVGFMLAAINDNGLFSVRPLGGWNPFVVSSQRFTLTTRSGQTYPIISSSVSPHLLRGDNHQNATPQINDILFDGGFESAAEAREFGIAPGDYIVPDVETIKTANGKNIISKAWDNRYGCTAVLETLEKLKDTTLPNTLFAGANVQEEVGLRGTPGAVNMLKPDLFFAVDCSAANDLETTKGTFGHLGEGTLIRIYDPRLVTLPRLKEFLLDTASDNNIPYQYFVSQGGTDAGAAQTENNGIPSSVIGVCARYIHTHQTMFSIRDYEAAKELLEKTILGLDRSTVDTIIKG
ncbi:glutamyl aminopeptidase [Dellaglioa algida]|uniref:Glutamyl aminopeptidase n=2 Tax=Dellaglioa algida TaxID=105612 RepID=A0A0R1HRU0_9LACO|nr:glutamyl aminopeptidase [Dellaglioa algida DSM 15638]SOB52103.1 glutamyl aminopeptidase [Dellaglioa algida]